MASKLPSMVVSAVTTFDGKALKKGSKEISAFEKGAKKAGLALAAAFGAKEIIKFGKDSIKAFAENEKSAKRLATVVKNLGLAFETPMIEKNLDEISAKYGLQGEVLREAYQKLITATGSVTKSQDLLNLSLDVSAGTGEDLVSVNQDLAALYQGNTKGLKKYNLGLSQAQLKTLKFEDGVKLLTQTFAGAASAELTTFDGKLRVLAEAADSAKESIGEGLVTALQILAGEGNTVQPLADSMADFGTYVGDAIIGTGLLIDKLKKIPGFDKAGSGGIASKIALSTNPLVAGIMGLKKATDELSAEGAKYKAARAPISQGYLGSMAVGIYPTAAEEAKRKKAEADRLKLAKERAALDNKAAKAEKQKVALTKAAAVFDSTRISLAAALKSTYDKETRLRLEALMLIEQDKGDEALKKIGELAAFQKNADMQRLAGVETISNATLGSLNTQLLTELKVINTSKMAEGDKELAREEAFKKYNAAITAAGTLSAKESYNERVQIQLTEIARLAALSKTTSATNTANLLLESAELSMIDRVAKAQAEADAARLKALGDYAKALSGIGTGVDFGGNKLGTPVPNFVPPDWVKDMSNMGRTASDGSMSFFDPARVGMTSGGSGGNQTVELTINTGIGDPEAIARAVEDILNQSTYRGTAVNRGTGNYFE